MNAIKLYHFPLSGHSHRAQLMLSLLGLEPQIEFVDLAKGANKTPEFLALNVFGQVPVIDDNGTVVADSTAILVYLANKYDTTGQWLPRDAEGAAQVQRWLAVAAGQINNGPARARLITVFGAGFDPKDTIERAHAVLRVIEHHLEGREFLATEHATIADVAGYSYIAHAPEGNVSLDAYPNVRAWLARIESLKGFVPMPKTRAGLVV
ncbi:glutathione S-transferase [Pseudomonas sp. GD03842]|uniref:glutathione S-transferase family protein n=1 Tax=unclassified Pseudomonas TaxID=196821 RepID=UPI000D37E696|nr:MULTISPECIES: glutathione S-transferase [unclassified Pseudomonas]MDH0748647.1 glutathione S-transferase [Pseudomonas sp. GD03842]RAU44301.1 glutathione S-transferase [Pseudomonas sp. RIT 409]RAU51052.1 glutathione S-transferase [Pseudomonas sp. RIT 412]